MTAQYAQEAVSNRGSVVRSLPPLILHPFAEAAAPDKLLDSSRASLVLQGLLPQGETTPDDLQRALLDGRYSEIRMLFYVGKDLLRWVDQAMDCLERSEDPTDEAITRQSLASLLIQHTPEPVTVKLKKWGVNDYKAIFSRGLGLNAMFCDVPPPAALSDEFLRNYFRYADQLFFAWQSQSSGAQLNPSQFQFDLYSSGEYARRLEKEWD